jgi:DNA (cytosine-5)-methyltransferase 1
VGFGGGNTAGPISVSTALTAHGQRLDFEVETFVAKITSTLPAGGNGTGGDRQPGTSAETAGTMLVAHALRGEEMTINAGWAVRRLTPRECERLQGFPDDFTDVPWRGKQGAPDGPRYKALGNSMAVNVMRWIGQRIDIMEGLIKAGKVAAE